jgi:hypothetical protein
MRLIFYIVSFFTAFYNLKAQSAKQYSIPEIYRIKTAFNFNSGVSSFNFSETCTTSYSSSKGSTYSSDLNYKAHRISNYLFCPELTLDFRLTKNLKLNFGIAYNQITFSTPDLTFNRYYRKDYFNNSGGIDSSGTFLSSSDTEKYELALRAYSLYAGIGYLKKIDKWLIEADLSYRTLNIVQANFKKFNFSKDQLSNGSVGGPAPYFEGCMIRLMASRLIFSKLYFNTGLSFTAYSNKASLTQWIGTVAGTQLDFKLSNVYLINLQLGLSLRLR